MLLFLLWCPKYGPSPPSPIYFKLKLTSNILSVWASWRWSRFWTKNICAKYLQLALNILEVLKKMHDLICIRDLRKFTALWAKIRRQNYWLTAIDWQLATNTSIPFSLPIAIPPLIQYCWVLIVIYHSCHFISLHTLPFALNIVQFIVI